MTNTVQGLTLYDWEKNLTNLKEKFDIIKLKKSLITNKEIIQQLNADHAHADHILLRQFLQNYSKPQQLLAVATFTEVKTFFDLFKLNYRVIEENYLNYDSLNEDNEEQEKNKQKNGKVSNFQRNKISLSKYIKDESEIYKKSLMNNLEQVKGIDGQEGIMAEKMHKFINELLIQSKQVQVYEHGRPFSLEQNHKNQLLSIIQNYAIEVKAFSQSSLTLNQMFITENQMLQFLTFWLKSLTQKVNLVVIYTRTQSMMIKLKKQYLNTQNQLIENTESRSRQLHQKSDPINQKMPRNLMKISPTESDDKDVPVSLLLKGYKEQKYQQQQLKQLANSQSHQLSKEQKLDKIIPELFTFVCKRRGRIHKRITFDQILEETKAMNLEKFINFCNYLQIKDLIARDLLIEEFKLVAINRLTLNIQKFGLLLKKMIQKQPQIIKKVLEFEKMSFLRKKDQIKKLIENQGTKLSKYNYQIRPVNGKDIKSIQVELQEKKKVKQTLKQEKEDIILKKKMGLLPKNFIYDHRAKKHNHSQILIRQSHLSFKIPAQMIKHRNEKKEFAGNRRSDSERFNPEQLITNLGQNDKLWDEYESKIWGQDKMKIVTTNKLKDKSELINENKLEEVLQNRIKKGNIVLKKINSTNLKYYI